MQLRAHCEAQLGKIHKAYKAVSCACPSQTRSTGCRATRLRPSRALLARDSADPQLPPVPVVASQASLCAPSLSNAWPRTTPLQAKHKCELLDQELREMATKYEHKSK